MNRVFLCFIVLFISLYFILTETIFQPLEQTPDTIAVQVMFKDDIEVLHVAPYTTVGAVLDMIDLDEAMSLSALNHNQILVDQDIIRIPCKTNTTCIALNTADQDELQLIPGVGEKTAQLILEYRRTVGSFKTVEDLLHIKGIGEKKLEKMRPYLCL